MDDKQELETVNGVYNEEIPEVESTLEIPELTAEEADEYKENEIVEVKNEGGL